MKTLSVCFSLLLTVAIAAACAQTTDKGPARPFWLYKAGNFRGAGDYSYGSGKVAYGSSTVIVTGDEAWQPRMPNDDLNTGPYRYVTVSIKPTQKQTFISGMEMIGDKAIPGSEAPVDLSGYGPNPMTLNEWNVFKVPLTAYGIKDGSGLHVYKIMFQGQNVPSPTTNKVEFDAVGFLPE